MASHVGMKLGRLKKRPEFLSVNATQTKWVSGTVIVQAKLSEIGQFRFGVTATKKTGNAVTRNRIKRRLRGAINDIGKNTEFAHYDVVLVGRAETALCDWNRLVKDLRWCLKRLGVTETGQEKP